MTEARLSTRLLRYAADHPESPVMVDLMREAAREIAHPLGWHLLTDAQRADIVAHIAGLTPGPETYDAPRHGWTCFHCGSTFKTEAGARLHFGETVTAPPVCQAAETPGLGGFSPVELVEHVIAGHLPRLSPALRRGIAEETLRVARGAVEVQAAGL